MTRTAYRRGRKLATRQRQGLFLRALIASDGSRIRAVEASGLPYGTVLRWQATDPHFRERYEEIRDVLVPGEWSLREQLMAKALPIALGEHPRAALSASNLRRLMDALDQQAARVAKGQQLERNICEMLLREAQWLSELANGGNRRQ